MPITFPAQASQEGVSPRRTQLQQIDYPQILIEYGSNNGLTPVSQYRHDRFAKLYVKALYKTKGNVRENIPVRRDEDLAIDSDQKS